MGTRLSSPTLVGRTREMAELEAALQRADTEDPTFAVVDGEAGIGKTRLVAQFAATAREHGAIVLSGAAIELAGGSLPYAPLVGVLRELVTAVQPAHLVAILGPATRELASLVPALGELAGPDAGPGPRLSDQTQLFETVLGVAERLGRTHPAVIVLEDLQWADRSTLDLLVFLVRNVRHGRVLLLVTYRTDAIDADHPLEHVLVELGRDRRTVRISLERFGRDEIAEQIRAISGVVPPPDAVARIHALSDGNPFFVEELLAVGPGGRPWAGPGGSEAVPVSLRRLLIDRYRRLPEAAQTVARIVAVVGEPAGEELIGRVGVLRDQELYSALREALDQHVLVATEGPDGEQYDFRHALLGEAVAADLLPGERRDLHASIATVLAEYPAAGSAAGSAATLAHHWSAAGRWPEALAGSIAAGQAAIAVAAYAEAAGQLDRAIAIWGRVPDAESRAGTSRSEVLDLAADAAFLAGDFEGAIRLGRGAIDAIDRPGPSLAASRAHRRLGSYLSAANDDEAAAAELATALRLLPEDAPPELRARTLAGHGAALMLLGRYRESATLCEAAIDVARHAGDRVLEAPARNYLGVDLVSTGRIDAGLDELRRATELAGSGGPPDGHLEALHNLAGMLDIAGRSAEALETAQAGIARAREIGLERRSGAGLHSIAGTALVHLGRWAEADATFEAGLALDPRGEHLVSLLRDRGRLHVGLGRDDDAAALLAAAVRAADRDRRVDSQTWLTEARAELAIWQGRQDAARDLIADGLARLAATDDILRVVPLCLLGIRGEADRAELARARRASGEVDDARETAERLLDAARSVPGSLAEFGASPGPVTAAELLAAEAEWLRCAGERAGSADAWSRAADTWAGIPLPYPEAYARYRAAEAALVGRSGREFAAADLRAAAATARTLGAAPLSRLVGDLARRARIDLAADGRPSGAIDARATARVAARAEAATGTDDDAAGETPAVAARRLGLTKREVEILGFVAEGRTNRSIAEALFITEKTAGVHLSNILGKLGVSNRVEAGAVARRLGLAGGIGGSVSRTFLFTDIVRSTNLVEAIGDAAWVDLLGWHDRTLRSAFVRAGGEEIDHAGDGFFVAFPAPVAAASCAIAIQRMLAEHRAAHGFAPMVQIGIHAGEAVRTATGYAGKAIHEAARIAGAGNAGEIVASATTPFPATVPSGPARTVELRGVSEPVEVVQIDWMRR